MTPVIILWVNRNHQWGSPSVIIVISWKVPFFRRISDLDCDWLISSPIPNTRFYHICTVISITRQIPYMTNFIGLLWQILPVKLGDNSLLSWLLVSLHNICSSRGYQQLHWEFTSLRLSPVDTKYLLRCLFQFFVILHSSLNNKTMKNYTNFKLIEIQAWFSYVQDTFTEPIIYKRVYRVSIVKRPLLSTLSYLFAFYDL